jgi:hypothetical protein
MRARLARVLHRSLLHPSHAVLKNALDQGVYAAMGLTGSDLDNSLIECGMCSACMEGKMKAPSEPPSNTQPARKVGQRVVLDLWPLKYKTMGGNTYWLICIDEFSGYMFGVGMQFKSEDCVVNALYKLVEDYNMDRHRVDELSFDPERVLISASQKIKTLGVRPLPVAAGLHAKQIERGVQTLKNKIRAAKCCLSYECPAVLEGELIQCAIKAVNYVPNLKLGMSSTPYQMKTGRKPVISALYFGQLGLGYTRRNDEPELRSSHCLL